MTAIPVYNEEWHLKGVLAEVRRFSPNILIVNDGSTDATAELLAQEPGLRIVTHPHNRGYGAALISSFAEALAKTFDGKHPCKLCKFVAEGKKSEKKHQVQFKIPKLDLLSAPPATFVFTPPKPDHSNSPVSVALDHTEAPPTPPPRLA